MSEVEPDQAASPAGWYKNPSSPGEYRYWDGKAWKKQVKPLMQGSSAVSSPPAQSAEMVTDPIVDSSYPPPSGPSLSAGQHLDTLGGEQGAQVSYHLSGWWRRVGATIIDGIIVGVITAALGIATGALKVESTEGSVRTSGGFGYELLGLVIFGIYCFIFLTRAGENNGQTLGKQALGIKVLRNDGKPVDGQTILLREIFFKWFLGVLTLGLFLIVDYLWPLPDGQNRALHDHGAKTHVVKQSSDSSDNRIFVPQ